MTFNNSQRVNSSKQAVHKHIYEPDVGFFLPNICRIVLLFPHSPKKRKTIATKTKTTEETVEETSTWTILAPD